MASFNESTILKPKINNIVNDIYSILIITTKKNQEESITSARCVHYKCPTPSPLLSFFNLDTSSTKKFNIFKELPEEINPSRPDINQINYRKLKGTFQLPEYLSNISQTHNLYIRNDSFGGKYQVPGCLCRCKFFTRQKDNDTPPCKVTKSQKLTLYQVKSTK